MVRCLGYSMRLEVAACKTPYSRLKPSVCGISSVGDASRIGVTVEQGREAFAAAKGSDVTCFHLSTLGRLNLNYVQIWRQCTRATVLYLMQAP